MEYVLERVDEAGESYFQNQVMVLKPQIGKSKQKPIRLAKFNTSKIIYFSCSQENFRSLQNP